MFREDSTLVPCYSCYIFINDLSDRISDGNLYLFTDDVSHLLYDHDREQVIGAQIDISSLENESTEANTVEYI